MIVLTILIIILILSVMLLFIPSNIVYSFEMDEYSKKSVLVFEYLFIKIKFYPKDDTKKEKKKKETDKKEKNDKEKKYSIEKIWNDTKKYSEIFKEIKHDVSEILLYAKKHAVELKKIDFNMVFDRIDPMNTGILTGALNGTVYNTVALLDNSIGIDEWKVNITPLFSNKEYLKIEFYGILRVKHVHIIVIICKILGILLRIKKAEKKNKGKEGEE